MKVTGTLFVISLLHWTVDSSLLDPVIENVHHIKADHPPEKVAGIWKKKMLWKPRWLKQWKSSNVVKPVWKKFWGPVIIREWVPIPKPPPDWGPASKFFPKQKKPSFQETPFINIAGLPEPNFGYLNKPFGNSGYNYDPPKEQFPLPNTPSQGNHFNGANFNHQTPHLPISINSQTENYRGQSSYGGKGDNGDFDLNPPVEQYDPQAGYGYDASSSSSVYSLNNQNSHQSFGQTHHHGHHHHYHHHHHGHEHKNSDLSKFPPIWNSWKSPAAHTHSNLQQQASSAVSVVSKLQATTLRPGNNPGIRDYLVPPNFRPGNGDFIQQASLVGEYHYSEVAAANSTQIPNIVPKQSESRPSDAKLHKTFPKQTPTQHLSNFKVLPANLVETYHYVEPIPSNQTQSKATLIGKSNQTITKTNHQSNKVSIITPRPHEKVVSPFVAQIAHAVVKEHIRNTQTTNTTRTLRSTTETTISSTKKIKTSTATSSSSKNKLENYSTEQSSSKPQNVIIVTPVPHKKVER